MVRLLVGQHDRDKDIAERRKKTIKVVVNNEKTFRDRGSGFVVKVR